MHICVYINVYEYIYRNGRDRERKIRREQARERERARASESERDEETKTADVRDAMLQVMRLSHTNLCYRGGLYYKGRNASRRKNDCARACCLTRTREIQRESTQEQEYEGRWRR